MSDINKVWSKFSVTNKNGNVLNFRIVNLPKERYGEFVELFMEYFAKEESTFRASGIPNSEEALEEMKTGILNRADDESFHTVVCCLDKKDEIGDIVGASIMMLSTPGADSPKRLQGSSEAMKKLYLVYGGILAYYDMVKEFNLDRHFVDRGLFVHGDFRGLGIAQELFRVRRMICKEYGITMHGAWMTSYGTQKAAERDGWETVCEIQYDKYGKKHGVTFENGPPSCKFMITRIL